jgi:chemotaxis signal transduction protein
MKRNTTPIAMPTIITLPTMPPAVAGTFNLREDVADVEDAATMLECVLDATTGDVVRMFVGCVVVVVDTMTKSGL